ncbi:MAG: HAD-IB family phosphatase [Acidobacteriota bacterium]
MSLADFRTWAVFSDFDGTISHPDTLNFLAESFRGVEFRREIGTKIRSGEISLREGIRQEIAAVCGSLPEVLSLLEQHVTIDRSFPPFAHWCKDLEIPVTVLSGGMRQVIEHLLAPYQLTHLTIVANSLRIVEGQWTLEFLDESPWGHDKARAIRQAKEQGLGTVFVGDGFSDRRGAQVADLVFAKDGLASFCLGAGIPFTPFCDFAGVAESLLKHVSPANR